MRAAELAVPADSGKGGKRKQITMRDNTEAPLGETYFPFDEQDRCKIGWTSKDAVSRVAQQFTSGMATPLRLFAIVPNSPQQFEQNCHVVLREVDRRVRLDRDFYFGVTTGLITALAQLAGLVAVVQGDDRPATPRWSPPRLQPSGYSRPAPHRVLTEEQIGEFIERIAEIEQSGLGMMARAEKFRALYQIGWSDEIYARTKFDVIKPLALFDLEPEYQQAAERGELDWGQVYRLWTVDPADRAELFAEIRAGELSTYEALRQRSIAMRRARAQLAVV